MDEERAIYAGLALIGGAVVAITIANGDRFDGMQTVAGVLAIVGTIGFLRWRRDDELPKARGRFKGD